MIGKKISHYHILEKLGEGAMGVVYKAEDLKLKRIVALKFLPPELTQHSEAKERFIHEAQAASALDHPNICTIHEIDETDDGQLFIVMACYDGETVKKKIGHGPMKIEEAVDIAVQVAKGLAKAHEHGIIHRDIKPANVIVTSDGIVKILDFGLAMLSGGMVLTEAGTAAGTAAYMSPEQARNEQVDQRTDIWSLGILLYEMLAGRRPFGGENILALINSILNENPPHLRNLRTEVPPALVEIVARTLNKDIRSRYPNSEQLLKDLINIQSSFGAIPTAPFSFEQAVRLMRRPRVMIPALILFIAIVIFLGNLLHRQSKINWARHVAIPEITRLADDGKYMQLFRLFREVDRIVPNDPIAKLVTADALMSNSIHSVPDGADVWLRAYGISDTLWEYLGRTPLDSVLLPWGFHTWRLQKEGYAQYEYAWPIYLPEGRCDFVLTLKDSLPEGMALVPGGTYGYTSVGNMRTNRLYLEPFFIERFEVTNHQYKEFVDAGGYERQEFWRQPFVYNGKQLSWQEMMSLFRDATGMPGPSTWELGTYPEGKALYPVGGVSWYEAAAYAEFAGKCLPSIYHWIVAAGLEVSSFLIAASNTSSEGPARVGSYTGLGPYGTLDMFGNVAEWCWNEHQGNRVIMGGAWVDVSYGNIWNTKKPFDRSAMNGFRCIKIQERDTANYWHTLLSRETRDFSNVKPVSESDYLLFSRVYSYQRLPLNAIIEDSDSSSQWWIRQKIVIDAAYANERMPLYVYLPRSVQPPFQVVFFFPGAGAATYRTFNEARYETLYNFIVRSGRAVVYPVYKGTYERGPYVRHSIEDWRDQGILNYKDLARAVDYVVSRSEFDSTKLGYTGYSWGAMMANVFLALEKRIKAAVLVGGGFYKSISHKRIPEADNINFAPHVKAAVLMLNGRYDQVVRLENYSKPMFRLLGSEHKELMILESDHFIPRDKQIKATLDWFDKYLGPVKR